MKTTLLILIATIQISCAQTRTFKYTFDINSGSLVINFANNREFPEYSTSRAGKGKIKIKCRQVYLDFEDILRKYGNPNETENVYYHIDGLEIYTGVLSNDNLYLILIDVNGNLWKLSKPDALMLANKMLNVPPIILEQINNCADRICTCN